MSYALTVESVKLTPEQEIIVSQNENNFKLILETIPDENGIAVKTEGLQVENGVILRMTYTTPIDCVVATGFSEGTELQKA